MFTSINESGCYTPPNFKFESDRVEWIRTTIIRLSHQAQSAHLGSSLSTIETINSILVHGNFSDFKYRDRLIISKGHAAMALYACLVAHNLMDSNMLTKYLTDGSALWGHVTQSEAVPIIDASTGSLGHGLSLACGHSYGDRLRNIDRSTFVVMSDGECDEGSSWEAASFASHHALDNIVCVIDFNQIQGFGRCEDVLDKNQLPARWHSFGWAVTEVDGHDSTDLARQLLKIRKFNQPKMIIAHTVKGNGIARIENTLASHYTPALEADIHSES